MVESFSEIHNRKLFERYDPEISCPKCKSNKVIIRLNNGYFHVLSCNKCGYKK